MEQNNSTGLATLRMTASRGCGASALLLTLLCLNGCSNQTSPSTNSSPSALQTYVGLTTDGSNSVLDTFVIDRSAKTFAQDGYVKNDGYEQYVFNSGAFSTFADGILNIGITYGNGRLDATSVQGTIYNPALEGNWAVEWPGQGGFAGLLNQTVIPFAPNQSCPSLTTAQTFQFVTFPNSGDSAGTAFGSASIATNGGTVNFNAISQFNVGGLPQDRKTYSTTATGSCGPTVFGQTISVPDTVMVSGSGGPVSITPSATIAIGPTGFLVESNGYTTAGYQPVLGAGSGAVGLPQPSSPQTTSTVTGKQYVGFIYSTGAAGANVLPSSLIASFGIPNPQTACPTTLPAQTGTILYGGEFSNNDPSSNPSGHCDFAVDLGAQDANGLYPHAMVTVGAAFPRPPSVVGYQYAQYSFSAVAIVGQLQGNKYAIFLIGLDAKSMQNVVSGATQDWGIYLLQSN